ncbi:hypothetical protein TWF481_003912 [Arthrobotrys musiformis]|uniref:Uncharacterized protein n=1 Tax=Arthrobotrys musiformis TaxID=47236 RepID=A0AAV9WHY3_9PEZI
MASIARTRKTTRTTKNTKASRNIGLAPRNPQKIRRRETKYKNQKQKFRRLTIRPPKEPKDNGDGLCDDTKPDVSGLPEETLLPIGPCPNLEEMSAAELKARIKDFLAIKSLHEKQCQGKEEPPKAGSPKEGSTREELSKGSALQIKIKDEDDKRKIFAVPRTPGRASKAAIPTTPPAPTPSPLTATPPRPTPSPLTSPEPEPTREQQLAMSEAEFDAWVLNKSKEWAVRKRKPRPRSRLSSGRQPLPDIWNGESFFPEPKESLLPELWGFANPLPPDPDLEVGRRGYMELNGKRYDLTTNNLDGLESLGFNVSKLRGAVLDTNGVDVKKTFGRTGHKKE